NTAGIGARVEVTQGATKQVVEQMPTRGFLSSVDPRPHFGRGSSSKIDTLTVIWPDHHFQTLTNLDGDRILTLSQSDAKELYRYPAPSSNRSGNAQPLAAAPVRPAEPPPFFAAVTAKSRVDFKHEEDTFYDFNREPLMPHMLSTEGPRLAVADVNGDGLDDFYV